MLEDGGQESEVLLQVEGRRMEVEQIELYILGYICRLGNTICIHGIYLYKPVDKDPYFKKF